MRRYDEPQVSEKALIFLSKLQRWALPVEAMQLG
jgi:hypothetical protein